MRSCLRILVGMSIASELRRVREAKGLTQMQVRDLLESNGLKISFRTYQYWEGGATGLRLRDALKLREILGIELEEQGGSDADCRKQSASGE
jgi:transcriptional regulator with XRE-family HTH domain